MRVSCCTTKQRRWSLRGRGAAWWCSTELLQLGGQLLLIGTQTVRLGLGSTELALCGSKLRLRVLCLATSVAVID